MKITKAVIPAAGLGTRMLPISRCVPKEVLPIVDRPAISYLAEEAADSGITDILIITGRGKEAVENYFDYSPEYEDKLRSGGKEEMIPGLREICERVNICFMRQLETKGLGHAVYRAKSFTGDEPFMVLYGDDIIFSETPVSKQLINAYDRFGLSVAGMQKVPHELIRKYSSMDARHLDGRYYRISNMVEKPEPEQVYTDFAILGRVLLTSDIYKILENTPAGANNEIQLTDAMKVISQTEGMTGVDFEGKRYDLGSKLGLMTANVERAVVHPEIGEDFKTFLKDFVKTL